MRSRRELKPLLMKGNEVAQEDGGDTNQVGAEESQVKRQCFSLSFQSGVAKPDEDGNGNNAGRSKRTEKSSHMGNAGQKRAVDDQDCSKEIETPEKMTRQSKKQP